MIHRKKNDLFHKDATYNNLWQGEVVNRLKIPQGLSTLKYRRWSEVPLRETTCSTKTPHSSLSEPLAGRGRKQAQDPPGSLHTQVSSVG